MGKYFSLQYWRKSNMVVVISNFLEFEESELENRLLNWGRKIEKHLKKGLQGWRIA